MYWNLIVNHSRIFDLLLFRFQLQALAECDSIVFKLKKDIIKNSRGAFVRVVGVVGGAGREW